MWAGCRIWKSVVGNEESEECQYSLPLRLVNRDVYSVNSKNLELTSFACSSRRAIFKSDL